MKKEITKPNSEKKTNYFIWFAKNALIALFCGIFIFKCIDLQPGYNWAYNNLLKGNMEIIKKYPKLSLKERYEMKLGYSYVYLQFLKDKTPTDAVILYPDANEFMPKDKKSLFTGEVYNKIWATRFLYPRKLVKTSELGQSAYAHKITHVAIVNGLGFEKVSYEVETRFDAGVLTVKP